ncbi:hypothetical protein [Grimontia sp. NTOU-MAR1]|uniref:hypothetical protein n=1 Tax=Grimontia sp. NTOU-MAR1 TaxID=3111011 RepID=UPI002DBBB799|nr:hypothetical protein [Grimontia sp. NTOU-MAR1]WRV97536.1 hypothetical protein VP504_16090 [Grimontia sp. NTOU-MAR1]
MMKLSVQLIVLLLASLFSVSGGAATCKVPDSGTAYWSKKVAGSSKALGDALLLAKLESRPLSSQEIQKARDWKESIQRSAVEVNTVFGVQQGRGADWLVTLLLEQNLVDGEWQSNTESLAGLKFAVNDDLDDLQGDRVHFGAKNTQETVYFDTESREAACAAVMGCEVPGGGTNVCQSYLEGWSDAVASYRNAVREENALQMAKLSIAYSEAWDRYLTEARSQTLFDRLLTAGIYSDYLKESHFQLPPEYQFFAFHPSVLMEYVDDAADGSQFKAALAVEWIGINAWQSCFGANFACGASIVSTYSDRAGVDDFGHGLMFHIENSYSFGVTERDGDVGYFLTVDLLKAFEDKKSEVKGWQEKANELLGKE